eukprot:62456-Prorocentrum_minimum.AAC.3
MHKPRLSRRRRKCQGLVLRKTSSHLWAGWSLPSGPLGAAFPTITALKRSFRRHLAYYISMPGTTQLDRTPRTAL